MNDKFHRLNKSYNLDIIQLSNQKFEELNLIWVFNFEITNEPT